jgi:peptide-methionine (R)-S-oxide reductase
MGGAAWHLGRFELPDGQWSSSIFLETAGNRPIRAGRTPQGGTEIMASSAEGPKKARVDWRDVVEVERYDVLFEEATEPPGSSPLNRENRAGTYICAACHLPLFRSTAKFDSGTGWPSFTAPIADSIGTRRDFKLIWPRTEYHCAHCGGHQGHVFPDGPPPTGQRWCNNGLAILFVPDGEPLPPVREG